MAAPKTYQYHSYKNGVFQGLYNDVISDFTYEQEINSTGSAITIVRGVAADSYGEGSLVDFNNNIKVYEFDDINPNGLLIFQGYIVNYQPTFTETNQEKLVITVMGYGATLNDYVLESAQTIDVNQASQTGNTVFCNGPESKDGFLTAMNVIQSFTIGNGVTKLSTVKLTLSNSFVISNVNVIVSIFSAQADAESGGQTSLIASASVIVSGLSATVYTFSFAAPVAVISGNKYWLQIRVPDQDGTVLVYYDNTSPYVGQTFETVTYNNAISPGYSAPVSVSGSAYIITYQTAGLTQFSYNSQDPSVILKSIMDNFALQGGGLSYTAASIDLTSTTVTYTFNANTMFDAINKVLSLAPVGWYWYVDQATNLLHFHKVSSTAQHNIQIGKHIKNLSVEKRAQEIVNVVYFVGGPTGGVNLFNKYTLQTSINLYGRHALVYSDNNVTLSATAQIIANNILSTRGQIELRITLDILDDGGTASAALGFDIESIVLGESISFRSFGPGSGGTLWDVALWDVAKWDFDITDLSSVVVQVTRVNYTPDVLTLNLSTVPPDITKRVQDIYRNLQQANVLNNPTSAS